MQPQQSGRFLLTGSSSIGVQAKDADSLAGRACFVTLLPLSQAEIRSRPCSALLEYLFSKESGKPDFAAAEPCHFGEMIHAGGYPRLLSRSNQRQRSSWLRNYVQALQQHDIPALANLRGPSRVVDVLRLLAASATGDLNFQRSAERLQMSPITFKKVVQVLAGLNIICLLERYIPAEDIFIGKRPQVQFTDSGLLATLLKVSAPPPGERLLSGQVSGALFETFVFAEIAKHCNCADLGHQIGCWKDADSQKEVDLVIGLEGQVVGVEIKSASVAQTKFLDNLKSLAERSPAMTRGVVIYSGDMFLSTVHTSHHRQIPLQFIPASWLWG